MNTDNVVFREISTLLGLSKSCQMKSWSIVNVIAIGYGLIQIDHIKRQLLKLKYSDYLKKCFFVAVYNSFDSLKDFCVCFLIDVDAVAVSRVKEQRHLDLESSNFVMKSVRESQSGNVASNL
jgi:hypothetical protein